MYIQSKSTHAEVDLESGDKTEDERRNEDVGHDSIIGERQRHSTLDLVPVECIE